MNQPPNPPNPQPPTPTTPHKLKEPKAAGAPEQSRADELAYARQMLILEAADISALAQMLGDSFLQAVDLLQGCTDSGGTVLISGLGKSGLIGAKISATMASVGIPSHAVHPSEAAHGDLGRFRPCDTVICLSNSGETEEIINLAAILRQDKLPIISITALATEPPSSLDRLATIPLHTGVKHEAGAPFAAPTSSTTTSLALGDALALTTALRMGFSDHDFAKRHPGGALGTMLRPIIDVMRFSIPSNLAPIPDTCSVADALTQASKTTRRPGAILLIDADGKLSGIFTDGDLRRLVLHNPDRLNEPISKVMTPSPRTLSADARVADALRMIREHRQDEIPIVDAHGKPVGLLDVQDLIAMRLVKD